MQDAFRRLYETGATTSMHESTVQVSFFGELTIQLGIDLYLAKLCLIGSVLRARQRDRQTCPNHATANGTGGAARRRVAAGFR